MSETHPAEPDRDVVLVVLGGGGDLTRRLLLPGLGSLLASRRHPPRVTVVGVGRSEYPEDDWRAMIAGCVPAGEPGHDDLAEVAARSRYARLDVTDAGQLSGLLEREAGADGDPEVLAYFALPAAVTSSACHALADLGRPLPEAVQLVLEKPFGTSSSSAADLDRVLAALAPADRVHRVDHFLGLPGVHQLLALRMWNPALGRVWDHESIERVDVVFDETLALEGRAGFYDATGALEDMLQSHLLLVAALAAMEPPAALRAEELHASVLEVLRTMRVRGSDPVASARRARYTAGAVAGRAVPSYVDEEGVDGARGTETFAELDLEVRAPRWSGVPFRLRSGKVVTVRLGDRIDGGAINSIGNGKISYVKGGRTYSLPILNGR